MAWTVGRGEIEAKGIRKRLRDEAMTLAQKEILYLAKALYEDEIYAPKQAEAYRKDSLYWKRKADRKREKSRASLKNG